MKNHIYKNFCLSFLALLIFSCDKTELEDNIEDTQEINYKTNFPESITFPENSIDAVLLNISDDNGIESITTGSTTFEITTQDDFWYISPIEALDYETNTSTTINIKVIDELGNQETKSIPRLITDEDESVPPDATDENESGSSKLPITIKYHLADGSLYYIQSYEYDEQDRQFKMDVRYVDIPQNDYYTLTSYSGNTATAKSYGTQSNEMTGYNITKNTESNKPYSIELFTTDGSSYYIQSFEYNEQDRQIKMDVRYVDIPQNDWYTLTSYSGNTVNTKSYRTQSNELTGYTVTKNSESKKPYSIELFTTDGSLYYIQSFEYDEQDRQANMHVRYVDIPVNDWYTLTNYSGNTATAKSYKTQSNEFTGYIVTTFKE